jgi:hypothetical protein
VGNATTKIRIATGSSGTWSDAETGGCWSREDSLAGTTPVPIPTSTGTNFSWIKNFVLWVSVTGTTNISNRRINQSGATPTGVQYFWQAVAVASYVQASSGSKPTDSGSNGATPAGYTLTTTSTAVYDSSSVASSSTGPNGQMAVSVLGVDNSYSGGASTSTTVPSLIFSYDEA